MVKSYPITTEGGDIVAFEIKQYRADKVHDLVKGIFLCQKIADKEAAILEGIEKLFESDDDIPGIRYPMYQVPSILSSNYIINTMKE